MPTSVTDYLVIGKGLVGSAAARYLAITGKNVVLVGPDEPENWNVHPGVFASHYDEGRITRTHDPDPVWAMLARRSIAKYRWLEKESGVSFYYRTRGLRVGPGSVRAASKGEIQKRATDNVFEDHDGRTLRSAYPLLEFPPECTGFTERGVAGYINPRALIRAQVLLAENAGLVVAHKQVRAVIRTNDLFEVRTSEGHTYQAKRVLVAAGAYSNTLLARPLGFIARPRTILYAHIQESEVDRLQDMPTIIYARPFDPALTSVYILPPIRYPDGGYYIKIGGDCEPIKEARTGEELGSWFRSGGSSKEARILKNVLLSVIPDLKAVSYHHKPCVVTYTSTNRPFIDQIDDGLFVATGGCGSAAKSSDEIGRLGARLIHTGSWDGETEFDPGDFRSRWA